jgi:hypothetical protein
LVQLIIGIVIVVLGIPFLVRGWVFSRKPDHPMSLKAKERNMRVGLETYMGAWGRKVRRFGTLLILVGGALTAWGALSID